MVLYAIVGAMKHDPETTAMITESATRARNRLLKLLEASRQESGDKCYYEKIKDDLGRFRVAHRGLVRQIESSEVMHICQPFPVRIALYKSYFT
jgi:CHAD domain-containing protein